VENINSTLIPNDDEIFSKTETLLIPMDIVDRLGVSAAILIRQLHYWLKNSNIGLVRNGRKWVWSTTPELSRQLHCSKATVKRAIKTLKDHGLINTAQFDKHEWKHRNYFTINYDALKAFPRSVHNDPIGQFTKNRSYPRETTTETTQSEKERIKGDERVDDGSEHHESNGFGGSQDNKHSDPHQSKASRRARDQRTKGPSYEETKQAIKRLAMADIAVALRERIAEEGRILCRWHDDHSPSLFVGKLGKERRYRAIYQSCDARHDAIELVKAKRSVSFIEALVWLCDQFNLPKSASKRTIPEKAIEILTAHGIGFDEYRNIKDFYFSEKFGGSWCWKVKTGYVQRLIDPPNPKKRYRVTRGTRNCFFKLVNSQNKDS
jgi:hypothetical protein